MSTTFLSATTVTLLARMPLCCGERLGLAVMVVASREDVKTSNKVESAAFATMHNISLNSHEAVHCFFLQMHLVTVIVDLIYLCVKYKAEVHSKTQMVGDFNK